MFDAAINVNQFMLERGHKSVQSSTLLDLQRKWAFHLFIHERDFKYSANIFQAWSQPRTEALVLLFAEMYPRVYIDDMLIRKMNIDVRNVMPDRFNLNAKFEKQI